MSTIGKTYHIITIGCQMNKSDSERISKYLDDLGWQWSEQRQTADVVVLTTCGVRQGAEDRIYGLVKQIKEDNPEVELVLTGCLVNREDVRKRLSDRVDIWLPITDLVTLADKLGLPRPDMNLKSYSGYLSLKPKHGSKFSAFIPIGNGCNNFCTYCVVPYARGREIYRDYQEILKEVKELIDDGYKEITLIAQNVNSYRSGEYNFTNLLQEVDNIKGDFWIRFATSHPKDMSQELIEVIRHGKKICHHVHLPAQAGDNDVLRAMNRKYTIEHYLQLIKDIKKKLPQASLTTDVIVGFPNETDKQFKKTKKLFKKVKYDMAYISQYSPRFGTVAYNMEDNISTTVKKKREEQLTDILRKTAKRNSRKLKGKVVRVLVQQQKDNLYFGYTGENRRIRFNASRPNLIGKFVQVKITHTEAFGLEGELIS